MHKFLIPVCVIAALAGCASKEKNPPYLVVDPTTQIVSDVYIRYAGSTHETKSLGGAAYRQSAVVFSLNEAETLDVPTQERIATATVAVAKPSRPKHTSGSKAKAKPIKSKPVSKTKHVKAISPAPAAATPCPPVQVIIKETVYCKESSNQGE